MASQATHEVGVLWNTDCNYDAWIWICNQASGGQKKRKKNLTQQWQKPFPSKNPNFSRNSGKNWNNCISKEEFVHAVLCSSISAFEHSKYMCLFSEVSQVKLTFGLVAHEVSSLLLPWEVFGMSRAAISNGVESCAHAFPAQGRMDFCRM